MNFIAAIPGAVWLTAMTVSLVGLAVCAALADRRERQTRAYAGELRERLLSVHVELLALQKSLGSSQAHAEILALRAKRLATELAADPRNPTRVWRNRKPTVNHPIVANDTVEVDVEEYCAPTWR